MNGDDCLRSVGACIISQVRSPDACFRWGGDEFAVILGLGRPRRRPARGGAPTRDRAADVFAAGRRAAAHQRRRGRACGGDERRRAHRRRRHRAAGGQVAKRRRDELAQRWRARSPCSFLCRGGGRGGSGPSKGRSVGLIPSSALSQRNPADRRRVPWTTPPTRPLSHAKPATPLPHRGRGSGSPAGRSAPGAVGPGTRRDWPERRCAPRRPQPRANRRPWDGRDPAPEPPPAEERRPPTTLRPPTPPSPPPTPLSPPRAPQTPSPRLASP